MTIELDSAQERQLTDLAAANGLAVGAMAHEAIDRFLAYRSSLEAAVQVGRDAAARGDLLEHDEVVARVERLLAS